MKRYTTIAVAGLALFGCMTLSPNVEVKANTEVAASTENKVNVAPEGWTALFDGESLVGWTVRSGKAEYDVVDGTIKGTTRQGSPNTFLSTVDTYGDFELQFEVKLHNNELNSGVQLRSKKVNEQGGKYGGRLGGPQCEIEATDAKGESQSGYIYGEASGGWQSPSPNDRGHGHFKNGQWNHYHIIAKGNHIQTFINGEKVEDFKLKDDYYNRFKEGVIGLQVHSVRGNPDWSVAWRSIYIKELN